MNKYLFYFILISVFMLISLSIRAFVSLGMREYLEDPQNALPQIESD
jgi:hypothetical protein